MREISVSNVEGGAITELVTPPKQVNVTCFSQRAGPLLDIVGFVFVQQTCTSRHVSTLVCMPRSVSASPFHHE